MANDARSLAGRRWIASGLALGAVLSVGLLLQSSADLRAQVATDDVPTDMPACEMNEDLFPIEEDYEESAFPFTFPIEFADSSSSSDDEEEEEAARTTVEEWRDFYHAAVDAIIRAHMNQPSAICRAEPFVPASEPLKAIAALVEPWKSGVPFTEEEAPSILLEFLRTYRCALQFRAGDLYYQNALDAYEAEPGDPSFEYPTKDEDEFNDDNSIFVIPVLARAMREHLVIGEELTLAEQAMRRTLIYIAAADHMRPLASNVTCLEDISLEIRNLMSLAAETSACMVRIRNARGSLRTYDAH